MKVEIWSDIVCPFCYIGKRRFERALSRFPHKDQVEVTWKSFRLDPGDEPPAKNTLHEHLADIKGIPVDQARKMNAQVSALAKESGLDYDMDRVIPANPATAHRLIQLAKLRGVGANMEEALFRAYFTDGKDISARETLAELGHNAGLDAREVKELLDTDKYSEQVESDLYEARQIGVSAVPFFVFDDRYAVRGAQSEDTFLGALQKAWEERKETR